MKPGRIRRISLSLLALIALFCLIMAIPRILSAFDRGKRPVGYHFMALDYLALGTGLEKLVNANPEIPGDIEVIKDVEYKSAGGKPLQLDILKKRNLSAGAPLLVFIHGGGWKVGKRSDYLTYMVPLAEEGYVTVTLSYRLIGDSPYPACAEDVRDALKWLSGKGGKFGYDPGRTAVIGGSAGGHLALLAAYGWKGATEGAITQADSMRVKAVVDFYGPFDLTTPYARNHPIVKEFLATSYEKAPGLYREASPAEYIGKNSPPTLIFHGTSDDLVPVSQSDTLKKRLDRLGVPNVYCRLPLWPHAMDVVQRVNTYSLARMNEFFDRYLK
jgi:acetyl esterase/lipase